MLLYIANYLQEQKHACTQKFNLTLKLICDHKSKTQINKRGMKTKVAEDLDWSPDTHAYTQHSQVNTCWQHIHICHHSKCIEIFINKLSIGKSHAHKSNKSTHFLLYITVLYNICTKFTTKGSVNGSAIGCTTGGLSLLNSYTSQHVHKEQHWIPKTYSPPTDRNMWDFRFSWCHIPGDVILLVHQPHIIQFSLNCPEWIVSSNQYATLTPVKVKLPLGLILNHTMPQAVV